MLTILLVFGATVVAALIAAMFVLLGILSPVLLFMVLLAAIDYAVIRGFMYLRRRKAGV